MEILHGGELALGSLLTASHLGSLRLNPVAEIIVNAYRESVSIPAAPDSLKDVDPLHGFRLRIRIFAGAAGMLRLHRPRFGRWHRVPRAPR